MTFIVTASHCPGGLVICARDSGSSQRISSAADEKLFAELALALEPVRESVSDFMKRRYDYAAGNCALALLDRLNIPMEKIERLLDEMDREDFEAEA